MRPNFNRLSFRMVAEIEDQSRRARLTAKQECDSGGMWRIALQRFHDGSAQGCRAILIQQLEKLCRLPAG
jgi:hypothetical protein